MTTDSPHPLDVAMSDLPAHLHDTFAADVRSLSVMSGSLAVAARESALEVHRRLLAVESADDMALVSSWSLLHDELARRLLVAISDNITPLP